MKRIKRSKKSGLPPGSLTQVLPVSKEPVVMDAYLLSKSAYEVKHGISIDEVAAPKGNENFLWLEVNGVHDSAIIEKIGKLFSIHPLALEDIITLGQRPKSEFYDSYIFSIITMLQLSEDKAILAEQVCFVLGKNYLITFQEGSRDVFNPIRKQLEDAASQVRKQGVEYLFYLLTDAIVDGYFVVLENFGESIEALEEELVARPDQKTLKSIFETKKTNLLIRRVAWPLRESLNALVRTPHQLLSDDTKIYFRDVYDHSIEVMDMIENSREIMASMIDVYLSSISNRMNEVMKVLTIITTIFMPLTFIAGIYGMNFQHMPELHWQNGYYLALSLMLAIAGVMVAWFRKRKWI